jgi:hypothetical protein
MCKACLLDDPFRQGRSKTNSQSELYGIANKKIARSAGLKPFQNHTRSLGTNVRKTAITSKRSQRKKSALRDGF